MSIIWEEFSCGGSWQNSAFIGGIRRYRRLFCHSRFFYFGIEDLGLLPPYGARIFEGQVGVSRPLLICSLKSRHFRMKTN